MEPSSRYALLASSDRLPNDSRSSVQTTNTMLKINQILSPFTCLIKKLEFFDDRIVNDITLCMELEHVFKTCCLDELRTRFLDKIQ